MATSNRHNPHHLKIKPEYLAAVVEGRKTFEIRKNDRGFKVGDWAYLSDGKNFAKIRITYITDFEQKEGYVVFSFTWVGGGICQ